MELFGKLNGVLSFIVETKPAGGVGAAAWLAVIYLAVVGEAFACTLISWLLIRGNILRFRSGI